MVQDLTIEDLAKQSGLSLRTLRYYIQEGLLPGPDTAGKYASYSQEHLDYLAMITRLKRLHLPLKEIRHLLTNMTPGDMRRILDYQDAIQFGVQDSTEPLKSAYEETKNTSALEYIRELEHRQSRFRSLTGSPSIPPAPQTYQSPQEKNQVKKLQKTYQTEKEMWTKIVLAEGIEFNIREEETGKYKREIEELVNIAAELLGGKGKGGSKK